MLIYAFFQPFHLLKQWSGLVQASDTEVTTWDTGVDIGLLKFVGARSVDLPADFVSFCVQFVCV
jgi:probable 2-oxoglutarate dehydrogenase E1 component DHKTD1